MFNGSLQELPGVSECELFEPALSCAPPELIAEAKELGPLTKGEKAGGGGGAGADGKEGGAKPLVFKKHQGQKVHKQL